MFDVGEHLGGEVVGPCELAVFEQAARQDREEDLDLVEPRGVLGRKDHLPAWVFVQPGLDVGRLVGGEVVEDRDDLLAVWDLGFELFEELDEVELVACLVGK
jgi:hypothetical protein